MTVYGRENLHAHARSCHGIFCIPEINDMEKGLSDTDRVLTTFKYEVFRITVRT